jgi:hypothetical protein
MITGAETVETIRKTILVAEMSGVRLAWLIGVSEKKVVSPFRNGLRKY